MSSPYQRLIKGAFVVIGKEPDGDSVRFVADDLALYGDLHRSYLIQPTKSDHSVQLRFEGIDAPELHYGTAEQRLGASARDAALKTMGFTRVAYDAGGKTATASTPRALRGAILTAASDANGRPISYVLVGDDVPNVPDGRWIHVSDGLLAKTTNAAMLRNSEAYLTLYTSTPAAHRRYLRDIAGKAAANDQGVWGLDHSAGFVLDDQTSIGPHGVLILPKLFRRCTDYLKARDKGFSGELADWIRANGSGSRSENDQVVLPDGHSRARLADLLSQTNDKVHFPPSLLDIVFVEK
jgi:hypothetical protein